MHCCGNNIVALAIVTRIYRIGGKFGGHLNLMKIPKKKFGEVLIWQFLLQALIGT